MSGIACGIVGLPNVGKSTLFSALTNNQVDAENYPFCTIDPNIGVVPVPDSRLDALSKLSSSEKTLPANMHFVDIAGLVSGASKGEGLGNQFLANIRETDAIVQVVRCFEDPDVVHVAGKVDPIADVEVINTELVLADLQMVANTASKLERKAKSDKQAKATLDCLLKVQEKLDQGIPLRDLELSDEEKAHLKPYNFLTQKPILYVANTLEVEPSEKEKELIAALQETLGEEGKILTICAALEKEISLLPEEERAEMLEGMGLEEPGLHRLIRASFSLLGLLCFLTTGEKETRAWVIPKNSTAPQAAGKIHGDMQRGFIRAEVISYEDVISCGGRQKAKEAGKMRTEGKEYIVEDGDVIVFLHNA